jgi:hypothetical protein
MIVNFASVLQNLGPDAILRVMAAARNDADYYLTTLLPERMMPDYHVEAGNMTIRATMAGLVAMDSPYPEGGVVDIATFMEKSAKIAIAIPMTEEVIRTLQRMVREYSLMNTGAGAPDPEDFLTDEALNFFEKVVVQALKDTREWLRGQALKGAIDWTFNKKRLQVSYGFPNDNLLTQRTGNDKYSGSASKFWTDIKAQNRLLRTSARIIRLAHPDTVDDIVYNSANTLNVLNDSNSSVTVQKVNVNTDGTLRTPTGDARDTVTIVKYGDEGEVLDPANPGQTIKLPFIERGQLHAIGSGVNRGYRVGEGSTPDPRNDLELGYHHIAPTVEGDGEMGDWGRIYTPQDRPWSLRGEGVSNNLPVIEGYKRVVNGRTDMSS